MVKPLDNINLQTILANQAKISVEKPAKGANSSEFADIIRAQVQSQENTDGTDATNGPRFSKHAQKRIAERNLDMDGDEFLKLKGAIDKLKTKGGKDSLVITSKGAYIVDVANDTVVTAMSKEDLGENVFTKIDSTLFIN
jgi:flagellar operon protein